MGTLVVFIFLLSLAAVSARNSEPRPLDKKFDLEFGQKRSIPISDAPEEHDQDDDELEYAMVETDQPEQQKRFDPLVKRFDLYKRFDPLSKRFDPFMKRFDPILKRFDPFMKRFDPLYKRFDPFFKRFDPMLKKRFDREETVRNILYSLGHSKRNIIDPRAFTIGFGRR